jgi:hypothetical protein
VRGLDLDRLVEREIDTLTPDELAVFSLVQIRAR